MLLAQPYVDEFVALRDLEKAVRACGLPTMMVSGQPQLDSLAAALKAIEDTRAEAVATSSQSVQPVASG